MKKKKKVALILGGGCIKAAAFHVGVCSALQEKGFRFAGGSKESVNKNFPDESKTIKTYIGSSAGAIIVTFLASGFDVQTVIDAFVQGKKKNRKRRFFKRKEKSEKNFQFKNLPSKTVLNSPSHFKADTISPKRKLKPLTYGDLFNVNLKMSPISSLFSIVSGFFKKSNWMNNGNSGGIEFFLKKSLKLNGFFNTKNLEKYLRNHVCEENSFNSLGVNLYILTTQLNYPMRTVFGPFSSDKIIKRTQYSSFASISEAAAASASLPPFFAPVEIKNRQGEKTYHFDGDIRTPLATNMAEELGADLIISSYLVQPYQYTEELGSLHKQSMLLIVNQALYQMFEQSILRQREEKEKFKALYQVISNYMDSQDIDLKHKKKVLDFFEEKAQYKKDTKTLHIHPNSKDIEMFLTDHFSLNEKILLRIIKKGYKAAFLALNRFSSLS